MENQQTQKDTVVLFTRFKALSYATALHVINMIVCLPSGDKKGVPDKLSVEEFTNKYQGSDQLFDVCFVSRRNVIEKEFTIFVAATPSVHGESDRDILGTYFDSWVPYDENGNVIVPADFKALSE